MQRKKAKDAFDAQSSSLPSNLPKALSTLKAVHHFQAR
jgi:hypothetical protein